jgi:Uma2 family endonuclease
MRVVMYEAPPDVEAMLAERRRLGLDKRDEMWDGVLHMVPPPGEAHAEFSSEFFLAVGHVAKRCGLIPRMETGLFRAVDDYRVPDQLYRRPDQGSDRGAEGAELVVEVRSPRDETYEKIDFYSGLGVREMIVAHPAVLTTIILVQIVLSWSLVAWLARRRAAASVPQPALAA